jgi:enoyl-[acyl-carrier-protein] reductase (NADH)
MPVMSDMVKIDLSGKTALITGGTKGIGLASAYKLGEAGVRTYLTYKWGSAEEKPILDVFKKLNAPEPVFIEADVSVEADTDELLLKIKEREKKIDFFISNVGFAQTVKSLAEYKKRSLFKTLEYSTWPLIAYTKKIKEVFGCYPGHILGISSDGPDHFYTGYDYVAASKALLEVFSKYLSVHVFKEGSRINVIRFGPVKTESFDLVFGEDFFQFLKDNGVPDEMILSPEHCGNAVLALCSGLLDAMNGQIITVDNGMAFQDNSMLRYLASKNK